MAKSANLERLQGMIRRGELQPVMNDTKWAELRNEMLSAPGEQNARFRGRSVFAPTGFCTSWDGEFHHHMLPFDDWEWMELHATSAVWLEESLRRHGIPFSLEAGVVRVWGYTRPGRQPEWQ